MNIVSDVVECGELVWSGVGTPKSGCIGPQKKDILGHSKLHAVDKRCSKCLENSTKPKCIASTLQGYLAINSSQFVTQLSRRY